MGSVETSKVAELLNERVKKLKTTVMQVAEDAGISKKVMKKASAGENILVFEPKAMADLARTIRVPVSKLLISFGYHEPDGHLYFSLKDKIKRMISWLRKPRKK